jgi:hypothetical protein
MGVVLRAVLLLPSLRVGEFGVPMIDIEAVVIASLAILADAGATVVARAVSVEPTVEQQTTTAGASLAALDTPDEQNRHIPSHGQILGASASEEKAVRPSE